MKKLLVVSILIISSFILKAQSDLSFTGYIVDLPIYQRAPEKLASLFNVEQSSFVNLTRIRLKPTFTFWSRSRINLEYEIASFYTSTESAFPIEFGEKSNRQYFDLSWNPANTEHFVLNHYIDRLYWREGFDWGNITFGRQRISWGTGRIWNPTDLFNPINPANFSKLEKDGADAVSLKYNIGFFTDLNLVYNFRKNAENSNYGFRFRTNFWEYDLSMMGGNFDGRYVAGFDFAGNFFDAGLRGEGIYSQKEENPDDYFVKFILGADYQFNPELYALIEYHYNGEGKSNKYDYELQRLISGEILNLNRNYISSALNYQYTPLMLLTISNLTNLNDKSGFGSIIGSYSATENLYINLGFQFPYGDLFTEYWYYSKSIYFQAEYYF